MSKTHEKGMTLIVKTVTRLTVGLILLYGIHIVLQGDVALGGGFAGGVIIALSFIHITLAYGKEQWGDRPERVPIIFASLGALVFLIIGLMGFKHGAFFLNFMHKGEPFAMFATGTMVWSSMAIAVKVAAALFGVFIALVVIRPEPEKK